MLDKKAQINFMRKLTSKSSNIENKLDILITNLSKVDDKEVKLLELNWSKILGILVLLISIFSSSVLTISWISNLAVKMATIEQTIINRSLQTDQKVFDINKKIDELDKRQKDDELKFSQNNASNARLEEQLKAIDQTLRRLENQSNGRSTQRYNR